jgi:hypothetical protein
MPKAHVSGSGFWILVTPILLLAIFLQGCASAPGVGPVAITISSLPNGRVSAAYSVTLTASGGNGPYTWAIANGALPAGLTLSPSGVISGTPTQTTSGPDVLTIRVSDSSTVPQSAVATLTLTVVAAGNITITTVSLPNGQVGVAYSTTLAATGGATPYTWTLKSGTLPAGLALNPSGAITGTPTATANATPLTFQVTDSSNPIITATTSSLTLTIAPPTLVITTTSLSNGEVGVPYTGTLAATGGTVPYVWSSGALPAGLVLNAATGAITGTPTASATATPITFTVTDTEVPAKTNAKSLTLTVSPALTITTVSLPNAQVGVPYIPPALAATGGVAPYTWSLVSGSLDGLTLNAATGVITGTPTAAVNATPLTFKVSDSFTPPQTKSVNLTLTAFAGLGIITTSLPSGEVGAPYSATLTAGGGTPPYTWSLTSGSLDGLTLNTSTGAITGTPTAAVSATPLTFTVTDAFTPPQSKPANLTLTIFPALAITTTTLPVGQVGVAYGATLAATGGATPYTWSLVSGSLDGLTLNTATGAITGTPTAAVIASPLTFQVTDSLAPTPVSKTVNLTLTVAAGLTITTTTLPAGQVGVTYSATLAATGGTTPYTWALVSGSLDGLALDAATGAITGMPTAAVTASPLTFKVTDSSAPTPVSKTVNLTLTITAGLTITTTTLPAGQVGVVYSATLAATGGTTPYTWSLMSGSLDGLALDAATGAITGMPTAAVTASPLTFKVTDSSAPTPVSKTVNLTLTIAAGLTITTTTLPDGQVGVAYSATLAATGGTTPYTWSLMTGSLDGLALDAASGAITGMPTAAVTASPLTFKVNDSSTPTPVSKTVNLTLTIAAGLTITTTTLPSGQVGAAYNATLAATGGTAPFTWALTSGSLDGLALNTVTGAITGMPTASVTASPLTFKVTDSTTPTHVSKTANLTLTVAAGSFTVTVTPKRAGLTVSQSLVVTATTTDPAGVNWSVTAGGALSGQMPTSASFSAAAAGTYTVTATSVTDGTTNATVTIGVTDASGVTTYLNDNSRTGQNLSEHALTSAAGIMQVNATNFGKLFSCAVDASVYPQPLWVANLSIAGGIHNVVFVATEHDTVYAFDADDSGCTNLWGGPASLLGAGETWVKSSDEGGCGDLNPDIGIVGTPVIDLSSNTIYVVSKTKGGGNFFQRIHALDITSGSEKFSGPVTISAAVPGTGVGSMGGNVSFDSLLNNQRPALLLVNGHVIISWASHCDQGAYHGWVMSYSATTLAQEAVLNLSPDGINAGVWMSGNGPAADGSGNIYLATGNGTFDVTNILGPTDDYGDSIVKLGPPSGGTFPILSYFRSFEQQPSPDAADVDQGSGGVLLLPGSVLAQAGKDGNIYVANQSGLGGFSLLFNNVHQEIDGQLPGGMWGSPTYWNGNVYFGAAADNVSSSDPLRAFSFSGGLLSTTPTSVTTKIFGFSGPTSPISANGGSNGVVWALDNNNFCTGGSGGCNATVLHAYDATDLTNELWNSSLAGGDKAGNAVKFTVPTVANGKVYVGTRTELTVYGLKPN